MSGLRKAKKYDFKDSNMALVGTQADRDVKKSSAETEKAWASSKDLTGTQTVVYRINKFKVEQVPACEYGNFFAGDSYIIYHQTKKPDSDDVTMDIHFWIGSHSTQDEYGTAAYKTVELDNYHDDKPVQHREVQGHESSAFKSYFKKLCIMKGGYDTGFRHVTPIEYKMRLFRVKREGHGMKKSLLIKQVKACKETLTEDDVFILDQGDKIFQINGESCSSDEKFEARTYVCILQDERSGKTMKTDILDSSKDAHNLFDGADDDDDSDDEDDDVDGLAEDFPPTMFRLSDQNGTMQFTEVQSGILSKDKLDPMKNPKCNKDVFICDFGTECYVWIGKGASKEEKGKAMTYAHNYLIKTQHPLVHISVMKAGEESKDFLNRFH